MLRISVKPRKAVKIAAIVPTAISAATGDCCDDMRPIAAGAKPSRASANGTRTAASIVESSAPANRMTLSHVITFFPSSPNNRVITSVETKRDPAISAGVITRRNAKFTST